MADRSAGAPTPRPPADAAGAGPAAVPGAADAADARISDAWIEAARAAETAGDWDEALRAYGRALEIATAARDAERAGDVLRWIGTVHRGRGDLEAARVAYAESLATAEAAGLPGHRADATNCLALVEQLRGRLEAADELFGVAGALAEQVGDEQLVALVDQNRGILAAIRGDLAFALERFGAAEARLRQLGDDRGASWALHNVGKANAGLGRLEDAEAAYEEAFRLADAAGDLAHAAVIELGRAELHLERGDHARARGCAERAFEIYGRIDSRVGLAEVHRLLGVLHREMRQPSLSEVHLNSAASLARQCEDVLLEAEVERERALLHLSQQRNEDALRSLNRAHGIFTALQARRELADLEDRLDGIEDTYLQVVRTWGESIECKDEYTAGHCERVAHFTCLLAEATGVTGRDLTWLRMGAFLHDVGKTRIPDEVLNKPGKLTPDEWQLMKTHTTAGDDIITELGFPWDIRPIVRNHHEHWDGSGYPDGLRGEEIPLVARILTVADIYDALTTDRAYRPAFPREVALSMMESDAGRIIDPSLFALFRTLVLSGNDGDPAARRDAAA